MGDVTIAGKPQNRSRRTYGHAINAPIGQMAETLFNMLNGLKLEGNSRIPDEYKNRLEHLLDAPGEGSDHAVCATTRRLGWLHHLDSDWVRSRLVPLFHPDHPDAEPAWNGYLHDNQMPRPELFTLLKPHFLAVFRYASDWPWRRDPVDHLHDFLVYACYWHRGDKRYVSYAEARTALQQTDDAGRTQALWFLAKVVNEQHVWASFGKPFIRKAWPKEARFQTVASSRQFASLAVASRKHFPDIVRTISTLLIPIKDLDLLIYRLDGDEQPSLAAKYPEAALEFLDRLVSDDFQLVPYNLQSVVELIAETKPPLRQDPRWRRLNNILNQR